MSTQSNAAHQLLLIGLGTRGRMWTRVIDASPNARIAAAVDPHAPTREEFAAAHPGVPVFATHQEALAAGITFTAAALVTPPDGHLQQCSDLFHAGLPILAEKPLTLDLAESVRIIQMAEQHNLLLSVGLNFRYLPVHQKYKELLTSEFLGTVGFGEFIYRRHRDGRRPGINKYPLTMEQPMMLEQSIHHLDLIRYCYGREVESIMCRTWNPAWSMYADDANVHALLTLEGGIAINYFGTWSGGWNVPGFEWRTDCEGGVFVQRELFSDLAYAKTTDAELTPVAIEDAEAFYDDTAALLEDFLHALDHNLPAPCDGRDHLRTLALCFAGIESSRTGKAVVMQEFFERNGLLEFLR
ncbi:Gfo/Idh/MocA family protein [Granulicella cerasi]|uniref:Gfo/Idh/MocA family protein n=1 Tax=Granulicella cerasi TaxID=741063 RepID=A0ABW1ZAH9_9BACT|nr:Gfo/Idh/MocA family oxidoreductase [Granulicella cerasi]